MTLVEAAQWLRDRADSYWRQAAAMADVEDIGVWPEAFRTIARELRGCAERIEKETP